MRHEKLTHSVIGAFYDVYNELGYGFLESVYGSALECVLREREIRVRREHGIDVLFRGQRIGVFRADLLVEDLLIVELKAGPSLPIGAKAQLLNYLKASHMELGLLLFFGPIPEVKRVSLSLQ